MTEHHLVLSWLDAREVVSLSDLVHCSGFSADDLQELMEYGALVPRDDAKRSFSAEYVVPLRNAGKLRLELDLDLFTVALVVNYLRRIDKLEHKLKVLESHLPAHAKPVHREGPDSWHDVHALNER